jgi:hypothetical protein
VPAACDLHGELKRSCFLDLLHRNYFFRDVIQVGGNDAGGHSAASGSPALASYHYVRTRVQRLLVGDAGMTYRYSGVRLFAHPWSAAAGAEASAPPAALDQPMRWMRALNSQLQSMTQSALESTYQHAGDSPSARSPDGAAYNLALINYLDPSTHRRPLRVEPYYRMGPLAVGWHRDESLRPLSSIAVYHSSEEADASEEECWHIALKRAWDIETPAVKVPLHSGDAYIMAYDLNTTHQHAVLAGTGKRFSSTHRVGETAGQTLTSINARVCEARVCWHHIDSPSGVTLPALALLLSVSDELEFEWLRQFGLHGARHARNHAYYWRTHIDRLEEEWRALQTKIASVYDALSQYRFTAADSVPAEYRRAAADLDAGVASSSAGVHSPGLDVSMCDALLIRYRRTHSLRRQWSARYDQSAYYPSAGERDDHFGVEECGMSVTLPASEVTAAEDEPIIRPAFDEGAPVPFDLSHAIEQLTQWRAEFASFAH